MVTTATATESPAMRRLRRRIAKENRQRAEAEAAKAEAAAKAAKAEAEAKARYARMDAEMEGLTRDEIRQVYQDCADRVNAAIRKGGRAYHGFGADSARMAYYGAKLNDSQPDKSRWVGS